MQPAELDLCRLYAQCVHNSGQHPDCEHLFSYLAPIFRRIASRVASQFGVTGEAEDIVQEICVKLIASGDTILPGVPQNPSGALAYFSVLAANVARDFFRSRHTLKRGLRRTVSLDDTLAAILPGLETQARVDRELLLGKVEAALPSDRREQIVFRLYYRQGFTAREIAAIPALNLSTKGVESMLHRVAAQMRENIRIQGNVRH